MTVTFRLPMALRAAGDEPALAYLREYYKHAPGTPLGVVYSGALFNQWDSLGTRHADADRFTADDLVAVTFLSVAVPPRAANKLLAQSPETYTALLRDIEDRDLVDVRPDKITSSWAPWLLWDRLRELPGVDWVIASKLLARKRPRLLPIYDRVVKEVTGRDRNFWKPLCKELRANDRALHNHLLSLRDQVGLPETVTALRVFDVIAWMEGKKKLGL